MTIFSCYPVMFVVSESSLSSYRKIIQYEPYFIFQYTHMLIKYELEEYFNLNAIYYYLIENLVRGME